MMEFTRFFGANLVSGGRAAAGRFGIISSPDHTRSIGKTALGRGPRALYTGLGISVVGFVDRSTGQAAKLLHGGQLSGGLQCRHSAADALAVFVAPFYSSNDKLTCRL